MGHPRTMERACKLEIMTASKCMGIEKGLDSAHGMGLRKVVLSGGGGGDADAMASRVLVLRKSVSCRVFGRKSQSEGPCALCAR